MSQRDVQAAVEALVRNTTDSLGYDLVDLVFKPGRRSLLRIFIDRVGGVDLDDCTRLSRVLGDALDAADPIPSKYILEVSSPGLDRPLTTERDFVRKVGQICRVTWRAAGQAEPRETRGTISAVSNNAVILATAEEDVPIPLTAVVQAKLVF